MSLNDTPKFSNMERVWALHSLVDKYAIHHSISSLLLSLDRCDEDIERDLRNFLNSRSNPFQLEDLSMDSVHSLTTSVSELRNDSFESVQVCSI